MLLLLQEGARVASKVLGFTKMVVLEELLEDASIVIYMAVINLGPVSRNAIMGAILPSLISVYSLILAKFYPVRFGHWATRSLMSPQTGGIATIICGDGIVATA